MNYKNNTKLEKTYLAVISLLLFAGVVFSQSRKDMLEVYVHVGDSSYAISNFYGAHQSYKKAIDLYEGELKDVSLAWKCAESCRNYQNYKAAGNYYKLTVSKDSINYPIALFWYAEMLKYQGKYKEASKAYKDYYNRHKRDNNYFSDKAQHEIKNCSDSVKTVALADEKINLTHIEDKNINSQFSEYAPLQYTDSILFFSGIRPVNQLLADTALKFSNYFTKIFQSNYIDSTWKQAIPVNGLNSDNAHVGNLTFAKDLKTVFFSKCELKEKFYCDIYKASYIKGVFKNVVKLPDIINKPGYNTTNPHVAVTYNYGQILFFSSDRPGGQGKKDIWYARMNEDGTFESPKNCGKGVNTFGDEVTPYYDARDSLLFFSSEMHKSLGGYDIFKSQGSLTKNTWKRAENIGLPINTSYNETYYSYSIDSTKAYFVSNRKQSEKLVAGAEEAHSNDIYYYPLLKKTRLRLSDLVPIYLFFDNDQPDPGIKDTATTKTFEELYLAYIERQETYIDKNRTFWDQKEVRDYKEANVNVFFDSLKVGYKKLFLFAQLMDVLLKDGQDIVVSFKGYASPIGNTNYNKIVAKKRISCTQNFFNEFEGGKYNTYLNNEPKTGQGSLIYKQYPMGETVREGTFKVNGVVVNEDDLENNRERGVYDPAAALQRKIEILAVNFDEAEEQAKQIEQEFKTTAKKEEVEEEFVEPVEEEVTPEFDNTEYQNEQKYEENYESTPDSTQINNGDSY